MVTTSVRNLCFASLAGLLPVMGSAQTTVRETFTGATTNNAWYVYGSNLAGNTAITGTGIGHGGACLTASTTVDSTVGGTTGRVPGCKGNAYYSNTTLVGGYNGSTLNTAADPVGNGALRLTNGAKGSVDYGTNQSGAIVSATPYDTINGLNINFTTVTYGGDNGNGTGADGMTFFMSDAAVPFSLGSWGGSLGYACSVVSNNRPYYGVAGGFIGVGVDEYGNYEIAGTQTGVRQYNSLGVPIYTTFSPNSVTVRGAGNISYSGLRAAGLSDAQITASSYQAVANTCANGYLSDALNRAIDSTGAVTLVTANRVPMAGYPILQTAKVVVPGTSTVLPIYNQQSNNNPSRLNANPMTYNVNITAPYTNSAGTLIPPILNFSYNYNGGTPQKVVANQVLYNMPATLNFGFGGSTGGSSNIHEITCFAVAPNTFSGSSAEGNVEQDTKVRGGLQVFVGSYSQSNWAGDLKAVPLNVDGTTGVVTIGSGVTWDASCVLSGGSCAATGVTTTKQGPAARTILTSNGLGSANVGGGPGSTVLASAGRPFQWGSLTATQKALLDPGNASTTTSNVLNYYRGDSSLEAFPINPLTNTAAIYRARTSILGDILNSSPVWVGPPLANYTTFKDLLTGTNGNETAYSGFANGAAAGRINVTYIGSNDGMLHGFRSGMYANGAPYLTAANNDGLEIVSYVPNLAVRSLSSPTATLNYSNPKYSHNAFVDAIPGTGDLFYNGAWHTWLVGGTGDGGNSTGEVGDATNTTNPPSAAGSIFALDITNPTLPGSTTEAAAAANVIGDWQTVPSFTTTSGTVGTGVTNLLCAHTTDAYACGLHLGSTYGIPIIRRLHNGNWGVIFGNGLDSPLGTAGIYIMNIDIGTGAISFYYIDTGSGRTTASRNVTSATGAVTTLTGVTVNNGISNVASADLDGDHITDYVYAGDMRGNLWKFDLTSSNPASWSASSQPIYTIPAAGGFLRPISTAPIITVAPVTTSSGTKSYLLVDFATGRKFPQTATGGTTYASGTQGIYGIWDWSMSSWNSKPSNTSRQYASLASAPTASLLSQTLTAATTTVNGVANTSAYSGTSNAVCWLGSITCGATVALNPHTGWYVPFPTAGEQAIYNPTYLNPAFIVNTTIPSSSNVISCSSVASTGYTIAISLLTGGATYLFNTATNTNSTNPSLPSPYVGIGLGAVGTNFVLTSFNGLNTLVSTLSNGSLVATNVGMPPSPTASSRLTWMQLR